MKNNLPTYDICNIDRTVHHDLLAERLASYLEKHYSNLHTPHRHSFYHLVCFTEGKGSHTIDFNSYTVQPYQVYFMAPGQVHSWHFQDVPKGYIVHFNAELFSSFLQRPDYIQQFSFFNGSTENAVLQLPVELYDRVTTLFESILKEMQFAHSNLDIIRVLLLQLFIYIDRYCVSENSLHIPSQKLTLLNHFKQLIERNFRKLKLPKDYAGLMYITPSHLNALCQDVIGKTAGELIRNRMILEAKRLLTNASMNITEIAYDLGLQDKSYFTRFFKKA